MEPPNNYIYAKSTSGVITTLISSGNTLVCSRDIPNLEDCAISGQASNQTLLYNSATSKWENKTLSLNTLADVLITAPTEADKLVYSSSLAKWINVIPTYYSVNIYNSKLKDSVVNAYGIINLLDSANYDVYYEDVVNYGLTRASNQITSYRTGAQYKVDISITLSITSITGSSTFTFSWRTTAGGNITTTAMNVANNPSKTICISSIKTYTNSTLLFPSLQLNSSGSPSYTGLLAGDISMSMTICEA